MASTVGVRFTRSGRVHFFDSGRMDLAIGERVLVETANGPREGQVAIAPGQILYAELQGTQPPVLQRVDEVDIPE